MPADTCCVVLVSVRTAWFANRDSSSSVAFGCQWMIRVAVQKSKQYQSMIQVWSLSHRCQWECRSVTVIAALLCTDAIQLPCRCAPMLHSCRCCAAASAGVPCAITAAVAAVGAAVSWTATAADAMQCTAATVLIDAPANRCACHVAHRCACPSRAHRCPAALLRRASLAQQSSCSPASPVGLWWVSAVIMGE